MMVWKPLKLSAAAGVQLPAFLLSATFEADAYRVHLTDLTYVWSESLERGDIIRRSQEESTSIDPSDQDQFRILLEKIKAGLDGEKGTTSALTINADYERPTITLNVTVNLPGGLAALQWPIKLCPAPQSVFTSQLTMPLLGAHHAQMQEARRLVEVLESKDHVIQKLMDKLESSGTELGEIFPQAVGKIGRKIDRKKAEERVKGLGPFNIDLWKQGICPHLEEPLDPGQLITEVFATEGANESKLRVGTTFEELADDWWDSIKGLTVNLTTGRITTNGIGKAKSQQFKPPPKPVLHKRSSIEDDFQTQATPPHLASKAPKSSASRPVQNDITDSDDDDDLGGTSQASKIPDSFPKSLSQSQPQRSQPSVSLSPPRHRKLGTTGSKIAVPKSSPPPTEDDTATESSTHSPLPPKEKIASPSPPPISKSIKAKLGKLGGKKAPPPSESEQAPETERPFTPPSKPKGKLGKIGGKINSAPDPTPSENSHIKSSPNSTQEKSRFNHTTGSEMERGRSAKPGKEREKTLEARETSTERADRKRAALKKELEERAKQPVKKKRRF